MWRDLSNKSKIYIKTINTQTQIHTLCLIVDITDILPRQSAFFHYLDQTLINATRLLSQSFPCWTLHNTLFESYFEPCPKMASFRAPGPV